MAGTVIIGRVAVKVYPDTSDFKDDVQRKLNAIERQLEVEIPVVLDDKGVAKELDEIQKDLNRDAEREPVEIEVTLDEGDVKRDSKDLHEKVTRILDDVKIKVDVDTKKAVREIGKVEQAVTELDALKRPKLFEELENIKIFDPSNLSQYKNRIREINDEVRATTKLDAQRTKALADNAREMAKVAAEAEKTAREMAKIKFDEDFERQARENERLLQEIEDNLRDLSNQETIDLRIEVEGMTAAEREVDRFRNRIANLQASITPEMSEEEKRRVLHEIENLKEDMEKKLSHVEAKVAPTINTAFFRTVQARLAWLARTRIVTFIPRVSASAAKTVATTLAALSGARLSGDLLKNLKDLFKDLDKNLPKIGALTSGIVGLAASALSATSNILSVSKGIVQMGLAGLALPGILGGMAIGLVASVMGFKDMNKVMPEVVDKWQAIQDVVSKNFWKEAEAPIRRLSNVLLPQLSKGFAVAGTEVGAFFGKFSDSLSNRLTNALPAMFKDLGDSIAIAAKHTDQFADIITILGESGSKQLPRLATWFGNMSDKFASFLDEAQRAGRLDAWIETGISAIKDFGNAIKGASRILAGLAKAAENAGGTSLKQLGQNLNRIADVINKPAFQEGLTNVFRGAKTAMDNISQTAGPSLTKMFTRLSDTLSVVLPIAGKAIGTLLAGIAEMVATPAFQGGLVKLFEGIDSAVRSLQPAMKPLGDAFGALFGVLGNAFKTFMPIVSKILQTIAELFVALAPSINKVVTALGGAFLKIVESLAPVLKDLAEALGPVIEQLGGQFADALADLAPLLAPMAAELGGAILDAAVALAPLFADLAKQIGPKLVPFVIQLVDAFEKLLPQLIPIAEQLGGALLDAVTLLAPEIPKIVEAFLSLLDAIVPLIPDLVEMGAAFLRMALEFLPLLIDTLPQLAAHLGTIADAITTMTTAFQENEAIISAVWGAILGQAGTFSANFLVVLAEIVAHFATFAGDCVRGLTEAFVAWIPAVVTAITAIADILIATFKALLGINSPSTVFAAFGADILMGLIQGITDTISSVITVLSEFITSMLDLFTKAATWLLQPGINLINGLRSGINQGAPGAKTALRTLISESKNLFDRAIGWLKKPGNNMATGFAIGIDSGRGNVRSAGQELKFSAKDGLGNVSGYLTGMGFQMGTGLAVGLSNASGRVAAAASHLASLAANAVAAASKITSPSKVFADLGVYMGKGLAKGIEDSTIYAVRASKNMADSVAGVKFSTSATNTVGSNMVEESSVTSASGSPALQSSGGNTYNITNINPIAEPPSVTLNKNQQLLTVMG